MKQQKFGKNKQGINKRQAKMSAKDEVRQLKQAKKIADDGLIAQTTINGVTYVLLERSVMEQSLQNFQQTGRFEPKAPKELLHFIENHQNLMFLMNNMQYEWREQREDESEEDYNKFLEIIQRNSEIFAELDQFTFDFSDAMRKTALDRKNVLKEYKEVFDRYPVLNKILSGRRQDTPVVGCVVCG
jgi:hypothetical protein